MRSATAPPRADAAVVFDPGFYAAQAHRAFRDAEAALDHYLDVGHREGYDPHPLFETRYYLESHPDVEASGANPLLHFLEHGSSSQADPSPYFDTRFYYSQKPRLADRGVNALVHYLENVAAGRACSPNPLFDDRYYLATVGSPPDAIRDPLSHFLHVGRTTLRSPSPAHAEMMRALPRPVAGPLARGYAGARTVLFVAAEPPLGEVALAARRAQAQPAGVHTIVALLRRPARAGAGELRDVLVVEGFRDRADVLRPSSIRLLALTLVSDQTRLVVTDVPDVLVAARTAGVASYLVRPNAGGVTDGDIGLAARRATRIVFGSHEALREAVPPHGPHPANIAVRPFRTASGAADADGFAAGLLELAERDVELRPVRRLSVTGRSRTATRTIVVPCADWSVSGVNSALETIGGELLGLGWNLELLFTRTRTHVEASAGSAAAMPRLPYRYLQQTTPGVEGMWSSLISEIHAKAPCIVFLTYDFFGNSVVPALSEAAGAVMWVQADDGDYYEQAYRLGRYCNALVCVSRRIEQTIAQLHPELGAKTRVIHNTSVRERNVARARDGSRSDRMRIVYTGRLSQYQKRILDFVDLADALTRSGIPYAIELIGSFPPHDEAAGLFPQRAADHLAAGTIRVRGRLEREEIFAELRASDVFVLLSDFEGLPLSLVEAMAAGCVPVTAEIESGIGELVTPDVDGVVVPGRDYDRWAHVIAELWRDPGRRERLSAQAQATVRERFTVEAIAQQFDGVFRSVADEIEAGFVRPPALHWGPSRSSFGDVLPPPPMLRPVPLAGLR